MEPVQISDNGEDEFIYRIAHPFLLQRKCYRMDKNFKKSLYFSEASVIIKKP